MAIKGSKTVNNKLGKFIVNRSIEVELFHCEHCDKDKKAKITVDYTNRNNKTVKLCNGCYGYLLSSLDIDKK
jgi:hypothetical protein